MKTRVLLAGLIFGLAAHAAESGLELFQKAVALEKSTGNLEEALKLYQRIVKEFWTDRALVAKSFMQEAHCYELLGQDDQAVKIFEFVTREFKDQRQPLETAQAKLASLRFEVASIKRQMPNARGGYPLPQMVGGPGTTDPGHIRYVNYSLNLLILNAYDLKSYQLVAPDWLSLQDSTFVIEATTPPGATKDQVRRMLQNLLADRFKLTLHRQTKELPLYELVLAKKAPKLRESLPQGFARHEPLPLAGLGGMLNAYGLLEEKDGFVRLPADLPMPALGGRFVTWGAPPIVHAAGGGESIAGLAAFLSNQTGRHVIDKTGLTGNWDYNLEFALGASPANSAAGPSDPAPDLVTAVRDQLGLRMESKKGPVEILVVDHVESVPTEN